MTNPYIVRLAHPEDCVCVHSAGQPLEVRDITEPVDLTLKNEITCMIFHEVSEEKLDIGYHMHTAGSETFLPVRGRIEVVVNGCHTVMEPGDLVHIEPYMCHSFRAVEPDSAMLCLFQGFNMIKLMENVFRVERRVPGIMYSDAAFHAMYSDKAHKIDRRLPDPLELPREEIPNLVQEGTGLFTYAFPGLTLRLKVGMWQTHNQREMWEADLQRGARLTWGERRADYRLFRLRAGAVRLTVDGESFDVDEEAIIHLPPFLPFSIEALADSVLYDLDCTDNLSSFLEDLGDLEKRRWPTDAAVLRELMGSYGVSVTEYRFENRAV